MSIKLSARELEQLTRERTVYAELLARIERRSAPAPRAGLELTCFANAGGSDSTVRGHPTGGFLLRYGAHTLLVDPGENSLARLASLGIDAYQVTDVLASHSHNDHVGDLSSAVSAALGLGLDDRDCNLVVCPSLADYASPSSTKLGFTLPAFAWKARVRVLYWKPVETLRFDGQRVQSVSEVRFDEDFRVRAAPARHAHVQVVGFVFELPMGRLGYTSDTEYFPALAEAHAGCDVLWINMSTLGLDTFKGGRDGGASSRPVRNHLGYVGVCELIDRVRPRTAIVTHLGSHLIEQSREIEEMLRERFSSLGVSVHCPVSGDRFWFEEELAGAPVTTRWDSPVGEV